MAKKIDEKKKGAGLAVVAIVGGGLLGWALAKGFKPPVPPVVPQETVRAHFKFDYLGEGGAYTLQNSFGHIVGDIFDHVLEMTWSEDVNIPTPGTYEMNVDCQIPIGAPPKPYDAEALIRTPEMHQLDYLIKKITSEAITV